MSQKDKLKAKYDKTRKEHKKRRSEDNIDRRTKSITLEPVPGHRYPLVVIQLCVLHAYTMCATNCRDHLGDLRRATG